jgi:hypothetical protein
MPALAPTSKIHPLCYEHHSEMTLPDVVSSGEESVYACQEPSCVVHYSNVEGYFLNTQDQLSLKESPAPPHQYCSDDKYPMYLVEVQPEHPSFRLWRCPKCGFSRIGGQL